MKKYIQIINESLEECGDVATSQPPNQIPHQPVTMNVNMSASGEENVNSLMNIMKNAGLSGAEPVNQKMMPMRKDMDKYMAIMRDEEVSEEDIEDEGYDNTPGEVYHDTEMLTHNMAGGINKAKGAYASAEDGDNAMAVKNVKEHLIAALNEKKKTKKKPDADGDGVPDWADKKPGKDDNVGKKKGSKPKKGVIPPQFKKKK